MGAPKNFYNAVDQAKLGIDQIPGMVKDIADIKEDISKITPLPDVTSADNGDVLTVIEGAWGKGTSTKELPSVTSSDNNKILEVIDGVWSKGSSKINKTTLYTGDTLANTITLSDSMSNYSALLVSFKASTPTTHQPVLDSRLYNVDDLVIGVKFSKYDNDSNYISYTVSSDDEFTLADQAGSNWMVSRIVGIK